MQQGNMLAVKDLQALEDCLKHEQLISEKYKACAESSNDQSIKTQFNELERRHRNNFKVLYNFLDKH